MFKKVIIYSLFGVFWAVSVFSAETVNTYDDLLAALSNENADVILDMNGAGIDLDGGNGITIGAGQTVVLKNIGTEGESAWTDTARNIINNGTVAIDNVIFKENNTTINKAFIGAILYNTNTHVVSITNSVFDSNYAKSLNTSLWGGLLFNGRPTTSSNNPMTDAVIDLIQNVSFTNNNAFSEVGAPHGAVILNQYAKIGTIDNVLFENNTMTGTSDKSGGGHGVAIDNNEAGFIEKITNSTFRNNYTYRTGTQEFSSSTNYHASGGGLDNYNYIGEISSCVFEGNHASTESVSAAATGGAIMNLAYATTTGMGRGYIGKIVDTQFINNHLDATGRANGGAISTGYSGNVDEPGRIDEITNVIFSGNYAKSLQAYAYGGGITNSGNIGVITASFYNNYASAQRDNSGYLGAYGGAVHNLGKIESITADFVGNYAENTSGISPVAGGAIYNRNGEGINELKGNFENNHVYAAEGTSHGGAIYNHNSSIDLIEGNFGRNYAIGGSNANGGAINNNASGIIGEIVGDFTNNYAESTGEGTVGGGAIVNYTQIDSIKGNFVNNHVKSGGGTVVGGAIRNNTPNSGSTPGIGEISGIFQNNYAETEDNKALGGAIYNSNIIGNIKNSSFINNSVKGNEESKGGAICSTKDILITADNGVSLFESNTVNGENNAIYMKGVEAVEDDENPVEEQIINLNLSSLNNGNITFNDAIDGLLYNINISGDGTGVVRFDNKVENVNDLNFGENSVTHIGLNSKIYTKNMKVSIPETSEKEDVSSPIITVDVKVDKNKNKVDTGEIYVDNDIEGEYRVLVNALTPDVLDKKEDAVVPFLFAPDDDESTASSFSITRVIGSPYMWEGSINAEGETEGSTWYLNLTDKRNPGYVPQKGYPVVPEIIAGIGLQNAAIEQTHSVVRNVKNKVDAERDFCPKCGLYDNGWKHSRLNNGWVVAQSESANIDAPTDMEAKIHGIEAGFDFQGDFHSTLGVFVSYRNGEYELSGKGKEYFSTFSSDMDIDSYLAGLYYRYDRNLAWVFATIYGGMQKADVKTGDGVANFDTQGTEIGASIEIGQAMPLTRNLTLDPSVGLYYTQVNFDDADDNVGKHYEWEDIKYLEAEVGAKLEQQFKSAKIYIKPSVIKNLVSGDSVFITGVNKVGTYETDTLGRIEIGGRFALTEGLTGYGWANYTFGSEYDSLAFGAGLNYAW